MASGRTIFILDIDGTLIPSHEIDNSCYWHAVEQVFGPHDPVTELTGFTHVSDSGILEQWCQQTLGRGPHEHEIDALRARFLELIESAALDRPEWFEPRPGLLRWLEGMQVRDDTHLGIATGSWGMTAAYKLERAGLARFSLALATADDAVSRTDIMMTALERLGLGPPDPSDQITYIGDGPWDLLASRSLGWSFIGIAEGRRARQLRELGAQHVLADFLPLSDRWQGHSR